MQDIRTILSMAGRRLAATSFLAALHVAALVAAAIALALAVADRVGAAPFVAWAWVAPGLAVAALAAAALLWRRRNRSAIHVAVTVDERLALRERLSTALHCAERDDAFARAAVADAVSAARDPRCREMVRRYFRVQPPRRWWISPLLAIAAAGVFMAPQASLFAREVPADDQAMEEAQKTTAAAVDVIVKQIEERPELRQELEGLVDELAKEAGKPGEFGSPEDLKRDALKKVTEISKKLDEIVNGEKGKTAKAIEQMMAKLETPADGPAKELAEALAKGDFQAAQKAMQKLADEAKAGQLDPAQKEQLAQQLQAMGDQLGDLAKKQDALQQALQQAGLNPQLANNPQALQQALQQAQNLNPQQQQQLQQMVQAQQAAQQMCQGLGQLCQGMAQAMQQGNMNQAGQQGMQAAGQLGQMEQLQQLLQQAQACAGQCQGQGLGQGMSLAQALQQQGGGMGQWGQGSGGKAPLSPTPTGTVLKKENVPVVDGEIIASMLIDGQPIRGDSKAQLRDFVRSVAEGFDEAQQEDPLPRQYHDMQKHYFGELQKQVEAVKAAEVPAKKEEPRPEGK
jgi:hypothetical protein